MKYLSYLIFQTLIQQVIVIYIGEECMGITAFCSRHKSSDLCMILIKCLLLKQSRWISLIEEVRLLPKACGISHFTCCFSRTPDQTNIFHSFLKAFQLKNAHQAYNSKFTFPLHYSSYVGENIAVEAEAGVSWKQFPHLLLCPNPRSNKHIFH